MNIPGLVVVLSFLLLGAPLRAQTVADVVAARETVKRLDAAAARGQTEQAARLEARVQLSKLDPLIAKLQAPSGETDAARVSELRKLSKSIADALARERTGQTAADLGRETKEISAAFTKLYPERAAPPAQAAPGRRGAERVPDSARKAAARGAAGGQAAIAQPRQFYDGGKGAAAETAPVAPAGGISANGPRRRLKLSPATAPAGLHIAPPPAPAESAEVKACREAMKAHPEDAGGCATSPVLTPLKAGLFESIHDQFGTVKGLAMNLGFMLLGLAMSVLSGFGLIAKLVVSIASVGLLLWTLPPLLKQGWDAASKLLNTKAGDPEHARALLTLGKLGGTVLIMALMAAIGWGVGKSLTQAATTKIAAILEAKGVKSPLTAIDAAAPPALTAFLTPKAKPVAAGAAPEPIARSAKSAELVPEETLRRNAAISDREVRIGETMKQLGVERGFAERVADAHDRVPCPVGGCTPAQLRAKLEIMGRGPKADAAIRSGLAGEPPPKPADAAPALPKMDAPYLASHEVIPKSVKYNFNDLFSPKPVERAPAPAEPGGLAHDEWIAQRKGTRFDNHINNAELSEPSPLTYRERRITGGGHTEPAVTKAVKDISASLDDARTRYDADYGRKAELEGLQGKRALRPAETKELERLTNRFNREAKPPEPGKHWSESNAPFERLPDLPNGVKRVILPEKAFDKSAWRMMERIADRNTDPAKGYVAGGKTLFPEGWSEAQIAESIQQVRRNPSSSMIEPDGRKTLFGSATFNGQTVKIEVGVDAAGKITSGFPSWIQ